MNKLQLDDYKHMIENRDKARARNREYSRRRYLEKNANRMGKLTLSEYDDVSKISPVPTLTQEIHT